MLSQSALLLSKQETRIFGSRIFGSGLTFYTHPILFLSVLSLNQQVMQMARPLRIEFAGALYHVTARGNAQENIYRTDDDRQQFLSLL